MAGVVASTVDLSALDRETLTVLAHRSELPAQQEQLLSRKQRDRAPQAHHRENCGA
jgi:hypothetical protein